jgi:hypothetical protein
VCSVHCAPPRGHGVNIFDQSQRGMANANSRKYARAREDGFFVHLSVETGFSGFSCSGFGLNQKLLINRNLQ